METPLLQYGVAREYEAYKFEAEASTLGFAPGHWPRSIATAMGNGQPFILTNQVDGHGTRFYAQQFGCITLRVWND